MPGNKNWWRYKFIQNRKKKKDKENEEDDDDEELHAKKKRKTNEKKFGTIMIDPNEKEEESPKKSKKVKNGGKTVNFQIVSNEEFGTTKVITEEKIVNVFKRISGNQYGILWTLSLL
jgi:hypothetical protein